jgi:SAM-dependent methyltransferase
VSAPAPAPTTYHRLVAIKRRLPEWLLFRLDPYNAAADRFVREAALAAGPGARVLDAGAGDCRHAPLFAHARYFGTDHALGDAVAYDYGRLAFLSDVTRLPVRDGSLDVVVSINVLEHVAEPARALAELRRALRPGGRLFLVAPQSWPLHQAPHDFHRFTRHGLEHLLGAAGFAVRRCTALGGAFWNLGTRSLYLLTAFRGPAFPLAILLAPLFGVLVPLACFYLDKLDRHRDDTLGYAVVAERPVA